MRFEVTSNEKSFPIFYSEVLFLNYLTYRFEQERREKGGQHEKDDKQINE